MEKYPSYSYPDSGDSSPRSREIEFENPPPSWEDSTTLPPNYKVKFMVSYGGKIQPRSHDNLLSYVGGDTKILAVERSIKFNLLFSKLSSLISPDNESGLNPSSFNFKYQLPGEDLDALISVSNDDDVEHMMHEYDRMSRASSKPPRLRLFLFPFQTTSGFSSTSSDPANLGPVHDPPPFVDSIHSVPDPETIHSPPQPPVPSVVVSPPPPQPVNNNVDFLFGLDNRVPLQPQVPVQVVPPVPVKPALVEPELVHEMNRLQVSAQEQQHVAGYRQRSEENLAGNYGGEMYQKGPTPANFPTSAQIPAGYWQAVEQQHAPQQQQHQQQHAPPQQQQYHQQPQQQQPVYMMHAPPQSTVYHAPVVRPPPAQGYYQVQRMPSDPVYREQPVYNMPAPAPAPMAVTSNQVGARPAGGMTAESAGYQVGYDSAGRQVYYAAAPTGGVVTTQYQGVVSAAVGGGEMRGSGDGKAVHKVVPTSGGV